MEAASTGNLLLLEHLLYRGVHVDTQAEDGYTALHCAAKAGSVAVISVLLENGATIDLCNHKSQGRRPIHEAVLENHAGVVAYSYRRESTCCYLTLGAGL
jgi:ankyrin repeat protein